MGCERTAEVTVDRQRARGVNSNEAFFYDNCCAVRVRALRARGGVCRDPLRRPRRRRKLPSPAAACGSVAQAYRAAAPGDAIEVAAGAYGGQSVPVVAGRGGPAVDIHPASGASVSFAGLNIAGSYATVRGIRTGDVDIEAGSTVVQGVTVVGGRAIGCSSITPAT